MCHYITMVLPSPTRMVELEAIAAKYGRTFESLSNRSVEEHLRRGEEYFFTTKGMCDCGTTLGFGVRQERESPVDFERQIKKLRAKHWGEAKIRRWLEDKSHHQATQIGAQSDERWNDDWYAFLGELVDSKLVQYACLLLHWYQGPLSGRITLRGRERVDLRKQGLAFLLNIQEDVLYEFH